LVISVSITASLACTSWNWPMGRPNMIRIFEYSAAECMHAIAAPTTPNAMPKARLVEDSRADP
jgi:hypothetical protein